MPLFRGEPTARVVRRFSQPPESVILDLLDGEALDQVQTMTVALLAGNPHEVFSYEHAQQYAEERIKPYLAEMPDYLRGAIGVNVLASTYILEKFVATKLVEDPSHPIEEEQAIALAADVRTLFSRCYQMLTKGT